MLPDSCKRLIQYVKCSTAFNLAPASIRFHHTSDGGLLRHTLEVAELIYRMSDTLIELQVEIAVTAAYWHDYGKIYEYKKTDGEWHRNPNVPHHFDTSVDEFTKQCKKVGVEDDFRDAVAHCIRSHHGKLEWGSKEVPNSFEAVVLHYADMLSMFNDMQYRGTLSDGSPLL